MTEITTGSQVEVKLVIPPGRMLEVFGDRDSVLRRVEELVECEVVVRGNEIVLRGTEGAVDRAEAVFDGLIGLAEEGHYPTPETAERLYKMADGGGGRDTHAPRSPRGPQDTQPEGLHRRDPQTPDRLRHRPCGDGQDLSRGGAGRRCPQQGRGGEDHTHQAGGRGRRVARVLARRYD